ncbi:MAG: DUF998 domain-containing protein [Actinomycetota bacterium]|nr:DUF998 domain-containing protein [Actinomycetota bacterium]
MKPQRSPLGSRIDVDGQDGYVLSYFDLRRAVGYFGLALPIAVFVVGIALPPHAFLGSISAYYYVPFAGDIFGGLLWTIGVFLWFYDYERADNVLTSAAGTFAIGVALFPTTKQDLPRTLFSSATIHQVCAGLFFAILAILSLFYFTRGDTTDRPRKKTRNRIFIVSGLVIVLALLVAGLGPFILGRDTYTRLHVLFFCETVAIWAFGISWLVKGQRLFADLPAT